MPENAASRVQIARDAAAAALLAGEQGRTIVARFSAEIDRIVGEAWAAAGSLPGAALLALGGFGRRQMAPYSDVDLLLLLPEGPRAEGEAFAQALFTPLWDAGLELGTAARTHEQALEAVSEHTVATAMLDARFLAGDEGSATAVLRGFFERLHADRLETFIDAKAAEIQARRRRFNESVYLLEPNLKTGVGGLRDLATGLWIVHARHRQSGLDGVGRLGLLPRPELEALRRAEETLVRLRVQLHLQAGRRDDRLTFSAQERAARALGYVDAELHLGVEQLMRDYYLSATVIEQATDTLLDRCIHEARARPGRRVVRALDANFEAFDGRVTFREQVDVGAHPELLVELFVVADREGLPVHSAARDRVTQELERRGGQLLDSPPAIDAFLQALVTPGASGQALRGLHATGVLAGIVNEFKRLRARVQHDVYHVYTVDQHSIFAVERLLRLRAGHLAAEQPVLSRVCQDLPRLLPLAVATLFHDLGKGLGGDHSVKGEAIARAWGSLAGLDARTLEDVAFLVREHLRLPQVAFRRDLSDPSLVAGVVALCGTRERLDMLYVLTYVDTASVGPATWNEWRSGLLAELHEKCRSAIEARDAGSPPDGPAAASAGETAIRAALQGDVHAVAAFVSALPARYLATVSPVVARAHFEVWKHAQSIPVVVSAVPRANAPEACDVVVVADDRPGLLSLIAGALAAHSIDIDGAEIFSLAGGRVLDAFAVRGPGGEKPDAARLQRVRADLERLIDGTEQVEALLQRRHGNARRRAPGPAVTQKIRIDQLASREATVVDVFAHDRLGLLHDLADAFLRAGATIVLARVSTEGSRATDSFYLKSFEGRKIVDPAALSALEAALAAALAKGAAAGREAQG